MANNSKSYDLEEISHEVNPKFIFISVGNEDIIKAVEYQYTEQDLYGGKLYNLCFGDYIIDDDKIDDKINSNNGDVYTVFYTVLSTIPKFLTDNPNSTIMVSGSDTSKDFVENCKNLCLKNCNEDCKNANRRIKAYRYYVNKNYEELIKEYEFWGGLELPDGKIFAEQYVKNKEYNSVFL